MDRILSQEEINALFSAMAADDLGLTSAAEAARSQHRISGYDFRRADRISQDQLRSLHLMHDYFARNFTASLSAYLRAYVEVKLASVEQIAYSEFLKQLPDPTLFNSVAMKPLDGSMGLEVNPAVVFPMIDILLGGPGLPCSTDRNLTEIETNIMEGVIRLGMRDLRDAWRPVMEVELSLEGTGPKSQMFQLVSAGETVVRVALDVKLTECAGRMNLCIPTRMLKVVRSKFDQQWNIRRQKAAGNEAMRMLGLLQPARIGLSGELRDAGMAVDDLLKIGPADVIQLNARVGDPVVLCVCGVPKFTGRIVVKRGKRAFEIASVLP